MSLFDRNTANDQNNQENTEDSFDYIKRNRNSSLIIFIIVIAGFLLYNSFGSSLSCASETTSGRTKLDSSVYQLVSKDNKWFDRDTEYTQTAIQDGMVKFYEATGIQPFVIVVDEGTELTVEELNARAEDYYKNSLFEAVTDEGHTVFAFQPSNGLVGIYSGTDARMVMDADAVQKFRDILSTNYSKYKGTDILNKTFTQAVSKIMGRSKLSLYVIIILAVACAGYIVYGFIRSGKKTQGGQN